MKVKRKKIWAVFLLIILCGFFVSVAAEPFWYRESVQSIQNTQNIKDMQNVSHTSHTQTANHTQTVHKTENIQAGTMTAMPELAVRTVSLGQTALQIRINSTLRIFLAAVAVLLVAGQRSARYFPELRQIHTGDSREIICYIHKMDGKKKNASM